MVTSSKNVEFDRYRRVLCLCLAIAWAPSLQAQNQELNPNAKYLVIHADDAGMSHSVNMATIQGLESGIVTSASIMVPTPWFKEFAKYAKEHPQYDYGIHLTLNSEWENYRWGPVAPKESVSSLIDPEGYLWDGVDQVAMHAKASEVKKELKAQIDRAIQFGVPLSHLDTHMGAVVSRPDLVEVYIDLGIEYDLPILFLSRMEGPFRDAYPALADRFESGFAKLRSKKLPMLDLLLQFYGGDNLDQRANLYRETLKNLPSGVTQLIIHCGIDNDELRAISDSSKRRDQDRRIFTDPATRTDWIGKDVQLVSWKDLRELEKKRR